MAANFADYLADEVRARRAALRLSQQDVADMAGVSERFVRFVEQGKPSVQLDSLQAVLETLGLELRLSTRSREGARAVVWQPPSDVSRPHVPPSEAASESSAPESSGRP
jgi:y4mF family transcriptional regulator